MSNLQQAIDAHNAAYGPWCSAQLAPAAGEGWLPVSDLISRPEIVSDALIRMCETYGSDDRRVASSFFLKSYCNHVTGLGISLVHSAGIVPDVSPEQTLVRIGDDGQIAGLCLLAPPLTPDPSGDLDSSRRMLAEHWASQVLPAILEGMRPALKLGRRAMIGTLTDTIVGVALLMLQDKMPEGQLAAAAMQLIDHPDLESRTGVAHGVSHGREGLVLKRGSCCLAYRLDVYPYCETCPLIADEERATRLAEKLEVRSS